MLGETGDWDGARSRIIGMINGGQDQLEGLPAGYGTNHLVEALARRIEAEYGIELGMALPTLLAGLSGASQGGFVAPLLHDFDEVGDPVFRWTPLVVQFIGVAEAGQSKSTLLNEINGPLRYALDRHGGDDRRELVKKAKETAKSDPAMVGLDTDDGIWRSVYNGGLGASSVTDQGTQEGIRKNLIFQGGHRCILTAEPDVLQEVSAYQNKSSGSLGLMIRGWGQEPLDVDRSGAEGQGQSVREPSLPFVILMQPESFDEYTQGKEGRDPYVARGVFSRTLLCKAERTPVLRKFTGDWRAARAAKVAKAKAALGEIPANPMLAMRSQLMDVFDALVTRSNPYRVSKGIEQAWQNSLVKQDWMPRPKAIKRERLELEDTDAALEALVNLTNLREDLIEAVREADALNPGIGTILDALATRFADHAMRIAALLSLADDPHTKTVDTGHLIDVSTRLMPWVWANWWKVMQGRMEANGRAYVAAMRLKNPKGIDLGARELLLKALYKLEKAEALNAMGGARPRDIFKIADKGMQKQGGNNPYFRQVLEEELLGEGLVEKVGETTDATKKIKSFNWRLTKAGRDEAMRLMGEPVAS